MKILHIAPSFFPAVQWGGPIFANFNLCNALHKKIEVTLKVLTTNAASPDRTTNLTPSEIRRTHTPYDISYCCRIAGQSISLKMLHGLINKIQWADLVHLSAVYSFPTIPTLFVARFLNKPIVWSPHGALQRWRGTTKPFLKRCWESICKAAIDKKTCCIHVTSLMEKSASKKILPGFPYKLIPHGVEIPNISIRKRPLQSNRLRIIYIGRIHPIKGIENLIRGLALMKDTQYKLTICGTGETNYIKWIKKVCTDSSIQNHILFTGHLDGQQKIDVLFNSDVCIVPSYTENFGMVVAEALACGVPVICSTGAPWEGLVERSCGLWVDNDPQSIVHAIRQIKTMDLQAMGQRGRQWMARDFSWTAVADKMLALYSEMITNHTA